MPLSSEWRKAVDLLVGQRDTVCDPVDGTRYVAVAAGDEPSIALVISHLEDGGMLHFDLMRDELSMREATAILARYSIGSVQDTRDIGEPPLIAALAGALDVFNRGFLLS